MNPTSTVAIPPQPEEALCLFQSGRAHLAIRLDSVAEVLEVERIVPLPLGPPEILGLCTLRREVVPVVALQPIVEDKTSRSDRGVMVLILRSDRGAWALRVDPVGTIVASERIELRPSIHHGHSSLVVKGICRRDNIEYSVMDADATWIKIKERIDLAYSKVWGRDPRGSDAPSEIKNRVTSRFPLEGSPIRGLS